MNLNFKDAGTITHPETGITYTRQRADVTDNKQFWIAFRTVKAELLRYITIKNENKRLIAYRLKPETGVEYGTFESVYELNPKTRSLLLPYQPRAVKHLCSVMLKNGVAIDNSDTGLGKTYTSLAVCSELKLKPVIVCRIAAIDAWEQACAHFNITPHIVINWESIKSGKTKFLSVEKDRFFDVYYKWKIPKSSVIIFDECHMGSMHTSAAFSMYTASKGIPSISLSATLADRPARLQAYFHILNLVDKDDFRNWLYNNGSIVNTHGDIESLDDVSDMIELNKMLFPKFGYRLRYTDPDVKQFFPECINTTEIVNLGNQKIRLQKKAYETLMQKALEYKKLLDQYKKDKLSVKFQTVLKQRSAMMIADLRYRQYCELLKTHVLIDGTRNLIKQGKSVCIFVNFKETRLYLEKILKAKSIHGTQKSTDRNKIMADFQANKLRVLILMSQAGGQSISLHDIEGRYPRVSLICPNYDPKIIKQILGRIYRAGGKSIAVNILIYAARTVEQKVALRVSEKIKNISALNEGDLYEEDLFGIYSG